MAELYYSWAIRDALAEEMARDERVFCLGEDIETYGGAFRTTAGLSERFPTRVMNTPISENSIVGVATGAALLGQRPVVEIMFMDFLTLAMDQILNHATKFHYVYGEQAKVPLVIRTPAGGGRCYGPTHSQSLESMFLSVPGLKIAAPATPADAKGMLKSAIRDDNPVLFIEGKLLYNRKREVPDEEYLVPLGKARVVREGGDLTLVAYSRMVEECEKACDALEQAGASVELIDLRSLAPLDLDTVLTSLEKTGRVVLVEEGPKTGGVCAEISAQLSEQAFDLLEAPLTRVAALDIPIPNANSLEQATLPNAAKIAAAARHLLEEY
ncbi:MAG: alpha-ketoacid dehydrogenase subunit beta [Armatimonadetes bacterium CG_4_10_14_3_um_filter_66_18]|nr:alpha-ketoacid dehydrogenase subunit beta [Armatimonadota bacterium]OIP08687.1 MAG: alpha-ketoacid dehydrogenase subunit beta [Armatimonadetes bacterium CG2_30_66_41]PIU92390.1 MAG: alpha-ketoacid dehydrogenase subunit beta [Armatimonadetes bacterium CG06_land_8_20_14_3_00_66_21]PIX38290.1 MAG: alpha-ketoacid dehydrogenase subunit beta [Armatimonadetes bacterium CG_4_8_14_3_um_filter_66_20]PIY50898.1 MAG: alpha-ketoacid dehydrogenase subunit beta [Armatimonadetes bacterium CG_4_10_14_3_um_fi